jgi:hypothetical protein
VRQDILAGGIDVSDKPFEVIAECAMAGFPTNADITRITEQIERARRRDAAIARAGVQTPAVYKDRAYTLVTRFLVWAPDGPRAMDTVGNLLQGAGIHCRGMHLSGRALVDADLVPAAAPAAPRAGAVKKSAAKAAGRSASRGRRAALRPAAKKARAKRAKRVGARPKAAARPKAVAAKGRAGGRRTGRSRVKKAVARRRR